MPWLATYTLILLLSHTDFAYRTLRMELATGINTKYGAVLDQVNKAQLAEGFNMFLKAQHLAQGPTNNSTPEMANLKREAPMALKKTG
jgi:hypothetical protein